jgi:hypothetical protein
MTKQEILDAMQDSRAKLLEAINGLDPAEMQIPGVVGQWSVRDILGHITRWEAELVRMMFQLIQGMAPDFPTLTDPDFDKINARFQKENLGRSLDLILSDFQSVRKQTQRRLADFTEEQLSSPVYYQALKGIALLEYIASNTYEHEAEHTAQIMAWRNLHVDAKDGF